jgi:putative glutamine amidotransferase
MKSGGKMSFPVIGLTTYHAKSEKGYPILAVMQAYLDALVQAGGTPVLIPLDLPEEACLKLFDRLDGILFTGGGDIATERFHGEPHPLVGGVDPRRDAIELALVEAAAGQKKPFMGICRGCQVVNVGLGGTLYTHIPDQIAGAQKHDYEGDYPHDYLAHTVRIAEGSHLAGILGETEITVTSLHHQSVKDIPAVLQPVAYAPDGVIEALELPGHPFGFAIQWHPEWMTDQVSTRHLFAAFVEAADLYQAGR